MLWRSMDGIVPLARSSSTSRALFACRIASICEAIGSEASTGSQPLFPACLREWTEAGRPYRCPVFILLAILYLAFLLSCR